MEFVRAVFVYDRNRMNVLEVKKRDYKSCNSGHPLHNWTGGYGRDVVPLNVTKTYYFISAKGSFCHRGAKVAIRVNWKGAAHLLHYIAFDLGQLCEVFFIILWFLGEVIAIMEWYHPKTKKIYLPIIECVPMILLYTNS